MQIAIVGTVYVGFDIKGIVEDLYRDSCLRKVACALYRSMKKLTDVSKLHGLGWKHRVELKEGIMRMYDWYKESK